jgi:very-short-patch-repair endonuclease
MNYDHLSDKDKKDFILKEYEINQKSFIDIAKLGDTYANKIRRDAIKFNINIRNKSEAQKNALKTGKTSHPTKGRERSKATKEKIGTRILKSWANLSEQELQQRKKVAKANWEKKSEDDKHLILKQANAAVRETSKTGSKLEKFLFNQLLADGFLVEFHKEQSILNTKLQIDLFIPTLSIAIEIDGPSHFEPVWGRDALKRNKKYDDKKSGLIIGKGWFLIRIKQSRDFSKTRARLVFEKLIEAITSIKNNKNNTKIINIGD